MITRRHPFAILLFLCTGFVVLFGGISVWKFWNFGYNALDLGIFTQVVFNSAHGDLFGFTIHPHSYLGDHFTPLLSVLVPIFALIPRAETLLVLQSVIIASGAIPLYFIARSRLSSLGALGIAVLYVFNPIIHSITLFEFHILPLAIPLFLSAWYFFTQKRFLPFVALLAVSLLVREDVALITVIFGVLALLERRAWKWIVTPFVLSAGWFLTTLRLIAEYNQYGSYKFLYYYSWLGETPLEMLQTIVTHPLSILQHLASADHLFFLAGLFLSLLLIPLLAPRLLLFLILPWAQLALSSFGATVLSLETHYTTLFLPGIFLATIEAIRMLTRQSIEHKTRAQAWIAKRLSKDVGLVWVLLIVTSLYSAFSLGPLDNVIKHAWSGGYDNARSEQYRSVRSLIPDDASVASSYTLLGPLAARDQVYSMHYAFIGQRQYSKEPYALPDTVEYLVIDGHDLLTYAIQFPVSRVYAGNYDSGDDRLRALLETYELIAISGEQSVWKRSENPAHTVFMRHATLPARDLEINAMQEGVRLHGVSTKTDANHLTVDEERALLPLSLVWSADRAIDDQLHLRVSLMRKGERVWETLTTLAFGLLPTNEWTPGEYIETRHRLLLPRDELTRADALEFELVEYSAVLGLNSLRSAGHIGATITPVAPEPILSLELDSPLLRNALGSEE